MFRYLLLGAFTFSIFQLSAQEDFLLKKTLQMKRTEVAPQIDGVIDEAIWETAPIAKNFVEWNPDNGKLEREGYETTVRILYDDKAMYFAAKLNDPQPDSILRELAQRDDNGRNADWFAIWINPYKDGLSDINFFITSAGVQVDSRTTDNGDDLNWNSVWESEVKFTDEGWVVEVAIPYSALRFPDTDVQSWNLNLGRSIRKTRQTFTWSYINTSVGRPEIYAGIIEGISNIESPVRLSLLPYVSGYSNSFDGNNSFQYNLGMDLKYGLSEAFTLDMTLIPDFGQVAFDNQVLNLSPFEVRFNENRQFFTEGTELFNKGGLFYSRRIGDRPTQPVGSEVLDSNEVFIENPDKVQLINATKVSGRTSGNLGIGFFNAVTARTNATVQDTLNGETRDILTEAMANYNVMVLDQRFNQNSSITVVNTNVGRADGFRDANSTAILMDVNDKNNNYNISANYKQSQVWDDGDRTFGHATSLALNKISGQWRYWAGFNIESDTYNPNDLGFLFNNNEFSQWIGGSYQTFQPGQTFNNYGLGASINNNLLYAPREFSEFGFSSWGWFVLRSFHGFGYNVWSQPLESNDWFEARRPGLALKEMPHLGGSFWISTDYRRKFAFDINAGTTQAQTYRNQPINSSWNNFSFSPRYRFNDRLSAVYRVSFNKNNSDLGFVGSDPDGDVYIGEREIKTRVNTLTGAYIFNNKMSLKLNFRHYWSKVEYENAYVIGSDFYLEESADAQAIVANGASNINVNFWNIDLVYQWWFAPGSEISFVWKNSLSSFRNDLTTGYFDNLNQTFTDNPFLNSFSIKVLYYLDGGKILTRK